MTSCKNKYFVKQYEEILVASNLPGTKTNIINYSTMAIVWVKIVLHKERDWYTVARRNVENVIHYHAMVDINWLGQSNCNRE